MSHTIDFTTSSYLNSYVASLSSSGINVASTPHTANIGSVTTHGGALMVLAVYQKVGISSGQLYVKVIIDGVDYPLGRSSIISNENGIPLQGFGIIPLQAGNHSVSLKLQYDGTGSAIIYGYSGYSFVAVEI